MAVVLFHGDKGGTGKSTVCRSFLDWGMERGIPSYCVDVDTRNPDVFRVFESFIPTEQIGLKTENGWANLIDRCAEMVETHNIVVNLPGGIGDEEEKHKDAFLEAARQIGIPVVTFWVINRGKDSVNQLRHQLENNLAEGMSRMVCVCNQHWAPEGEPFDIWEASKTRQMFEERGGVSINFPALSERVVTALDKSNLPYSKAFADGFFGAWDSVTLRKWKAQTSALFDSLDLGLIGAQPSLKKVARSA